MSWQLAALDLWLRYRERPRLAREHDLDRVRAHMHRVAAGVPLPAGVRREGRRAGGVDCLQLRRPGSRGRLVYLHGGAYCLGSPETHAGLAAALAGRAGLDAVLPDYRLAPEHRFPAAVDDAAAAWEALADDGTDPGRTLLAGDSAGGGLALALVHRLLAAGRPLPAAVVLFSPWTDLTLSGESLTRLARREATLPVSRLPEIRDLYVRAAAAADPCASPLFGRFAGCPPVLIQASRAEILLDDTVRMAARLRDDGAAVRLDLWNGVPHVWQLYHGGLPEADRALDRAADFARRCLRAA